MAFNLFSMFGRMNYQMHLVLYPIVGGTSWFLYTTYAAKSAADQAITDEEAMPKS